MSVTRALTLSPSVSTSMISPRDGVGALYILRLSLTVLLPFRVSMTEYGIFPFPTRCQLRGQNGLRPNILFVVFIASLLSARAAVAGEGGVFTVFGDGQRSCGEYIEATEAEKKLRPPTAQPEAVYSRDFQSFADFTDGYFSGANSKDVAQYRLLAEGTDHAGRMAWLENYCRTHPIDAFIKALSGLRQYLAGQPH